MIIIADIKLDLALALLLASLSETPVSSVNTYPAHTTYFVVTHEPKWIWYVRLIGHTTKAVFITDHDTFFYDST